MAPFTNLITVAHIPPDASVSQSLVLRTCVLDRMMCATVSHRCHFIIVFPFFYCSPNSNLKALNENALAQCATLFILFFGLLFSILSKRHITLCLGSAVLVSVRNVTSLSLSFFHTLSSFLSFVSFFSFFFVSFVCVHLLMHKFSLEQCSARVPGFLWQAVPRQSECARNQSCDTLSPSPLHVSH